MKSTCISIWGYLVHVLKDNFDIYLEWVLFRNSPAWEAAVYPEQRAAFFVDKLVADGWVQKHTSDDGAPEQTADYFSWLFMESGTGKNVPDSIDMWLLKDALSEQCFKDCSVRLRELMATGYLTEKFKGSGYSKASYFEWLKLTMDIPNSTSIVVSYLSSSWLSEKPKSVTVPRSNNGQSK